MQKVGVWCGAFLLLVAEAQAANRVEAIDFRTEGESNVLEIRGNAPLQFTTQDNENDKQVVIDIPDAVLGAAAIRPLDTSSFDLSRVSMVSPYFLDEAGGKVRVVIQMREFGAVEGSAVGNSLRFTIPLGTGVSRVESSPPPPIDTVPDFAAPIPTQTEAGGNDRLGDFMVNKNTAQFNGKRISLQVREAEIADVLRMIGDASGFNIIVSDNVTGKISLALSDVPWDQALDVVLHTKQLGAERNGNILRVMTLTSLVQEKQAELDAKKAAQASAPRVTKVFPISYAKIADLLPVLDKFRGAQPEGLTVGEANVIQIDERTNQIIVRDLPDTVEKIQKLLELLDTQTPQVMVEAKVIEASEEFGKTLNGSLGLAGFSGGEVGAHTGATALSFNALDPSNILLSSGSSITGTAFSAASAGGGAFGFGQTLSFLSGVTRLNALLSLGESEKQLRVLSSPKIVVLNREQATITSGTPVTVRTQQTVAGVGVTSVESVVQANLSLQVKPTVTNDGSVLMELKITRDQPFGTGIANRSTDTRVLVESGSTLVIGGIYSTRNEKQSSGIPILRKIPIIGALFGSEQEKTERSELFIFVTPRIMNEKAAGLEG